MDNRDTSLSLESDIESAGILAPPPAPLRVIAADADLWMRLFYQELLPRMGHEVTVVESGLGPGERVVTDNQYSLRPGSNVAVTARPPGAPATDGAAGSPQP